MDEQFLNYKESVHIEKLKTHRILFPVNYCFILVELSHLSTKRDYRIIRMNRKLAKFLKLKDNSPKEHLYPYKFSKYFYWILLFLSLFLGSILNLLFINSIKYDKQNLLFWALGKYLFDLIFSFYKINLKKEINTLLNFNLFKSNLKNIIINGFLLLFWLISFGLSIIYSEFPLYLIYPFYNIIFMILFEFLFKIGSKSGIYNLEKISFFLNLLIFFITLFFITYSCLLGFIFGLICCFISVIFWKRHIDKNIQTSIYIVNFSYQLIGISFIFLLLIISNGYLVFYKIFEYIDQFFYNFIFSGLISSLGCYYLRMHLSKLFEPIIIMIILIFENFIIYIIICFFFGYKLNFLVIIIFIWLLISNILKIIDFQHFEDNFEGGHVGIPIQDIDDNKINHYIELKNINIDN